MHGCGPQPVVSTFTSPTTGAGEPFMKTANVANMTKKMPRARRARQMGGKKVTATDANTSGTYVLQGTGTIDVPTITVNGGATGLQTINVHLAGSHDLTIFDGNASASGTSRIGLGATNSFTGNLVFGSGGASVSKLNRVDINVQDAVPSTATMKFAGDYVNIVNA